MSGVYTSFTPKQVGRWSVEASYPPVLRLVWILSGCLFAAGLLFAAFAGWVLTDKLADRAVQDSQIQAAANLHGECKAAVDQLVLHNGRSAALLSKAEKFAREVLP